MQAQITAELLTDQQASILENFYRRSLEGLDPRVAAFIASGEMAVAYFKIHVLVVGAPPTGPSGRPGAPESGRR